MRGKLFALKTIPLYQNFNALAVVEIRFLNLVYNEL